MTKKATMDWFRIAWPVVSLVILLSLAAIGAFAAQRTRIAVIETKADNYESDMKDVKTDLKDIKSILMNR